MRLIHVTTSALKSLKKNKSRTMLTILGIVIGIASIILIVSIGESTRDLIVQQVEGLGSKTIIVIPGREPKGMSDTAQIFSDSLKQKDYESLIKKSNVPSVSIATPIIFGAETASYGNELYRATIFGTSENAVDIFEVYPDQGYFFTQEDVKRMGDVAVIGSSVKEKLFGVSDAIGKKIKLKNKNYRVVGVLKQKGQVSFFNFDKIVIIPYTTAQSYIFGIHYIHRIIVKAQDSASINDTIQDIQITLRNNHNITNPEKDDFFIQTQENIVKSLDVITNILTLFLVAVASISLIVGGIGIMNIMLVSVTERTREIGLRKALGATHNNILSQFLYEAITLTSTGGIIGILLGTILSLLATFAISFYMSLSWKFTFPIQAAFLGFMVSALVGLCFGLYPAFKASKKSPIEALHYE